MVSVVRSIISWVGFGAKIVGTLAIALGAALYVYQDKMLYIPNPPGFPRTPPENPPGCISPEEWSTNGRLINSRNEATEDPIPFEENYVTTVDGKKIHTWLLLQKDSTNSPTLIYFHGNAGNMGFRLKNAAEMYAKAKMNILMMDYRGYGASEGEPTEEGLNMDADAVLNFADKHPKLTNSRKIAFGRSLGGAVSVALAHRFPKSVSAIILENTFLSVGAMVDVLMPQVATLKSLILRIKWDSDVKINDIKQPILFISGDSDQLVPPFHMKKLHELASKSLQKEFYSVLSGTHNDTWEVAGAEYYKRLKAFIDSNNLSGVGSHATPAATSQAAVGVVEAGVSPRGEVSDNEEDCVEDPDYLMVKKKVSLPTMGTNFQVK